MKRSLVFLFLFLVSFVSSFASEKDITKKGEANKFGIELKGYVKNSFFYDTRQTVAAREGYFLLWPSPVVEDAFGNDLNARSSFNFLSIESRLGATFTGLDALGAKISAFIEVDFFGHSNLTVNLLRLRHAFIKMNWGKTELLTGQYWNPMFVTECYPGTVSFNTGVPIQWLSRNPQIRITHKIGNLKLIAAALAQRDFTSTGPIGPSSVYLRNAAIPDMHAQVHYGFSNVLFGVGMAYKSIVPRHYSVVDQQTYQVNESVSGVSGLAFAKITTKPLTFKFQVKYGENNSDLLAISGYAVKSIVNNETQEQAYTALYNTSYWADMQTNGTKLQVGLFAGMTTNHGTKDTIDESLASNPTIYGFGYNIEMLCRVSPRVFYKVNKLQIGLETELTIADYGKDYDQNLRPARIHRVENCRIVTSICYSF